MKKNNIFTKFLNTKFIANICKWSKNNRKKFWIICALIAFVIGGLISFIAFTSLKPSDTKDKTNQTKKQVESVKYYSTLTGLQLENKSALKMPVTAAMIENAPEARPQSGLKSAGVVFEAICEGGITRFLALYQQEKPQLVGPIRSVRMYYISWAAPFNAGIVHVGGNMDALAEIRNGNYRDLDQFANGESYWRSADRYAPHNMYTSFEKIDKLSQTKGYIESEFTGFSRTDGKPSAAPTATNIAVDISGELFNSTYTYDATTNSYQRFMAGEPHMDTEGQINPSSVIVMNVDEHSSSVPESHEVIATIGTGEAKIFQNGEVIVGTWSKPSQFDQITFTDADHKEISLVRGQTWIVAIPNGNSSVSYTAP